MHTSRLVAVLDTLTSFALVSARAVIPYVQPELCEPAHGHVIELTDARHPCVEAQDALARGVTEFVPNDVNLRSDDARCLIVTGPNMGGKSTYIRSIGVCCLLAQVGCFVPCSSAKITVRDAILTRLGASDSQLRGVSTFMAEMLETASILENASEQSLVIVDELGRGTSTSDGFGIAWAVAEDLLFKCKCLSVFATHFHELTALEAEHPNLVRNLHVSAAFGDGELTLLYKIESGPCDRSFGLHVAKLTNFPKSILEAAARRARELQAAEDHSADDPDSIVAIGGEVPVMTFEERQRQDSAIRTQALESAQKLVGMIGEAKNLEDLRSGFAEQAFTTIRDSALLSRLIKVREDD